MDNKTIHINNNSILSNLKKEIDKNNISTQQIFDIIENINDNIEKNNAFYEILQHLNKNEDTFNVDKEVLIQSTKNLIEETQDFSYFLNLCSASENNDSFPKSDELVDIIKDKKIANSTQIDLWFMIEFIIQPKNHGISGTQYLQILKNQLETNKLELNETMATHFIANSHTLGLTEKDKKFILSTYQQDNTAEEKIGQVDSIEITYNKQNVNLAGIVIEYNKSNNINLHPEQIQQLLFKTPKYRTDLNNNPILHSVLKNNESEELYIDNQFLIGLAYNNENIYRTDPEGNNLIHQSLLVNNTECAMAFIKEEKDLYIKNNKGESILDIAIENKNNKFLKHCSEKFNSKELLKNIDLCFYKQNNSLYQYIQVFNQSPYTSYQQLKDLRENNDITAQKFRDFILHINSNHIQKQIVEYYIKPKENNLMNNPNLYFEFFDIALNMPKPSSQIVYNIIQHNDFITGKEKNQLIEKLDNYEIKNIIKKIENNTFASISAGYTTKDVLNLADIILSNQKQLHYFFTSSIFECQNPQILLNSNQIEKIALKTNIKEAFQPENLLIVVFKYAKRNNINLKSEQTLNIINTINKINSNYDNTPLMIALTFSSNISGLSEEKLKSFVDNSNINHISSQGYNALALAINNYPDIAEYMVEKGADLTQPVGEYDSVIDFAKANNHKSFIDFCKENNYISNTTKNKVVSLSKFK